MGFHVYFTDSSHIKALGEEAKLFERQLPVSYDEVENIIRELEQAAINDHIDQSGLSVADHSTDFFVQADQTQLSCTNALRKETIFRERQPERVEALSCSYANLRWVSKANNRGRNPYLQSSVFHRWSHKNQINRDKYEVAKHIGKPLPINLKEANFPTTDTFNLLETFKQRLHSGQFRSDEKLNRLMSLINRVHKEEKKRLEQIRKRIALTGNSHWFLKKTRCRPRNAKGFARLGLAGYPFSSSHIVWDAVDFALRGCDPVLRQNTKKILKRKQLNRSSILKRIATLIKIQKEGGPSGRSISEATGVRPFGKIRINSRTPVPEPSIICDQCHKQKVKSVDTNIVPLIWIKFLVKAGYLCGQPKCVSSKNAEARVPQTKYLPGRKVASLMKVPAMPFAQYEKLHKATRRSLREKIVRGQSNVLVEHNIGVRGRTVLKLLSRDDPLGLQAPKPEAIPHESKEINAPPEGFLINKRLTF